MRLPVIWCSSQNTAVYFIENLAKVGIDGFELYAFIHWVRNEVLIYATKLKPPPPSLLLFLRFY